MSVDEIIIVASGNNILETINQYDQKLNIKYIHVKKAGQIIQRNIGLKELKKSTKFVIFLDDDILLEPGSIEIMMSFWKQTNKNTAGVGFNLNNSINETVDPITYIFKKLFNLQPGTVTRSGITIPLKNIKRNTRTQFLGGGYTVWRKNILDEYKQEGINSLWSQGEDLRYSYPISKKYKLYVEYKRLLK